MAPADGDCHSYECRCRKGRRIAKYAPINHAVKADKDYDETIQKQWRARRFTRLTYTAKEIAAELEELDYLIALMHTYPASEQRDLTIAYYRREFAIASDHAKRVRIASRNRRRGRDDEDAPDFAAAKWVDIVDLAQTLSGNVARKSGANWVMHCLFHDEDTPSFTIYPPGGGWYCFGCHKGGDAVALAAEYFQCGNVEALRWVEELCDVPGRATVPGQRGEVPPDPVSP